jgi:y4mF family transcriptional regulator
MKKQIRIASIVKFHRKKSGLSQSQFATMAGIGKTVIFDIEKGKESVQLNTFKKVLHALNIEIQFISPLMDEYYKKEKTDDEKS